MGKSKENLIIDYGNFDYAPAIVDYDFINNRPRGGSCRLDFFSYGKISSSLENLSFDSKIFLKKDNIFFEKGIFLLDFKEILQKPDIFIDMVENLKCSEIYLENSPNYNINFIAESLEKIDVILMDFGGISE